MKGILLVLLALTVTFVGNAKDKDEFRYEVVSVGVGSEGTEIIKVYSYAKNQKKAIEIGKKNAVHAILFKGVPASSGNYTKPALVKDDDKEKNKNFFDKFFSSGKYLEYVTLSTDGVVDPSDMLRVGNQYKIGIIFVINKNSLRSFLEEQGIIKGLNSMFE